MPDERPGWAPSPSTGRCALEIVSSPRKAHLSPFVYFCFITISKLWITSPCKFLLDDSRQQTKSRVSPDAHHKRAHSPLPFLKVHLGRGSRAERGPPLECCREAEPWVLGAKPWLAHPPRLLTQSGWRPSRLILKLVNSQLWPRDLASQCQIGILSQTAGTKNES